MSTSKAPKGLDLALVKLSLRKMWAGLAEKIADLKPLKALPDCACPVASSKLL